MERRTTWPRMHSCPVTRPAAALPTQAASRSFWSIPASAMALFTASAPIALRPVSMCLPKCVMPTPAMMALSRIVPVSSCGFGSDQAVALDAERVL
jgi:hypothetical protein